VFGKSVSLVRQMQRSGVHVLAGTDSPAPYVLPGFALHEELAMLVDAGLSPMEALQAATRNAGEFLATTQDSGAIASGQYADLVLLDANPLDDIHNTQRIHAVVVHGQILERAALDKMLADELSFASGH